MPSGARASTARRPDKAEAGGELVEASRAYRIRHRRDIADAPVSELLVVDGDIVVSATNITEATERGEQRLFMVIETTGEVVGPNAVYVHDLDPAFDDSILRWRGEPLRWEPPRGSGRGRSARRTSRAAISPTPPSG